MTPEDFIKKWRDSERKERAASQQHFLDLCELLEVFKPGDPGIKSKDYDFAVHVKKPGQEPGEVDVFKRNCFAWEYKGPKKSLVAAYRQLKDYVDALDNPPLLIVSDMREIQIHTNFTSSAKRVHRIAAGDLMSVESRATLRKAFLDPESLKPDITPEKATRDAAGTIGQLAGQLRSEGHEPRLVAHFLNKLVFCMFAEDIGLLPDGLFSELAEGAVRDGDMFEPAVKQLFHAMRHKGGLFGSKRIPWFNGGLFDDEEVIALSDPQRRTLRDASLLDWSQIEPSIFGTLFERGLDPAKRKEMASLFDVKPKAKPQQKNLFDSGSDKGVGIHYTDAEKIMKIVEPVVLRPLRAEWEAVKAVVSKHRDAKAKSKNQSVRTKEDDAVRKAYHDFRVHLSNYRVLDPACGSGNFLFLALLCLKDFDRAVESEARAMGLPADNDRVTTDAVKGIEINPYAADLARLTIWIGEIQWQMKNSVGWQRREPILGTLPQIKLGDALIDSSGDQTKWPEANAIIGNPPFLGASRMLATLDEAYVTSVRSAFANEVGGFADLVCFWFAKARCQVELGRSEHVGFVATNSIRGGTNRRVLDDIDHSLAIYDAWDDEPWMIDGAAVRVSVVCFASKDAAGTKPPCLNGKAVSRIRADLTASTLDLTGVTSLQENIGVSFLGTKKGGPFDVSGFQAREWLLAPVNINGRSNTEVVRPRASGSDLVRRPADEWVVDFGTDMSEGDAAHFEKPFEFAKRLVKPIRDKNRRETRRRRWWLHSETAPGYRSSIRTLARYIATPRIAKFRVFVWLHQKTLLDDGAVSIGKDDDTTFGILNSRFHEHWTLRLCTWLGVGNDPRYTPSTTFETFPFPEGLTPNIPAKDYATDPRALRIAAAAKALNEQREAWLNPADLVKRVPEVVPGYPDRILPVGEKAEKELKKRTLTNLYNERPQWLVNAHRALDEAVASAYGWSADLSDDEILARLLQLNQQRAKPDAGQ